MLPLLFFRQPPIWKITDEFIPARSRSNAAFAACNFRKARTWRIMSEFIPANDRTSVRFARRHLPDTRRSGIIEGFTLVKSRTGVIFAVPLSIKPRTSRITRKFIPGKSRIGNLAFGIWIIVCIFDCMRNWIFCFPSGVIYARSVFPIVSRSSVTVRSTRSTVKRRETRTLITRLTHSKPTQVVNNNSRSSSNSRSRRNKAKSWSWTRPLPSPSAKGKVKWCSTRSTSVRWPSQSLNDSAREYLSEAGKEVNFSNLFFNGY